MWVVLDTKNIITKINFVERAHPFVRIEHLSKQDNSWKTFANCSPKYLFSIFNKYSTFYIHSNRIAAKITFFVNCLIQYQLKISYTEYRIIKLSFNCNIHRNRDNLFSSNCFGNQFLFIYVHFLNCIIWDVVVVYVFDYV